MLHRKKQSKNQNNILAAAVLGLAVLTVLAGCSGSGSGPVKTSTPGTVTKQTLTSSPTQTTIQQAAAEAVEYNYVPGTRRDPFAPIMEHDTKKTKSGERPPLERYNLSELKLSGVVWGGFGYSAMVEGPDGKGYFVRTGTILGPNRGVVKKITQNTMIIEEKFKTYTGETERKEIMLELRKKQEVAP